MRKSSDRQAEAAKDFESEREGFQGGEGKAVQFAPMMTARSLMLAKGERKVERPGNQSQSVLGPVGIVDVVKAGGVEVVR